MLRCSTRSARSLLIGALGATRALATLAPVKVGADIPAYVGGPAGAPAVIVIQGMQKAHENVAIVLM